MPNFLSIFSAETAKVWTILGPLAIIAVMLSSGIALMRFKTLWKSLSDKKYAEDPSGLGIKVIKKYRRIAMAISTILFIIAIINLFAIVGHFTVSRSVFGDYADFIRSIGTSVASLIFMPIVVFMVYSLYKPLYNKLIVKRSMEFWIAVMILIFSALAVFFIKSSRVL